MHVSIVTRKLLLRLGLHQHEALIRCGKCKTGFRIPWKAKVGRSLAANLVKCPFVLCIVETQVVAVERRLVLVLIRFACFAIALLHIS